MLLEAPSAPPVLKYRAICPEDKDRLKELHEAFFPVKYSDSFYSAASSGKGIGGLPIYSVVVTVDGLIVGFILAQFMPLDSAEDNVTLHLSAPPLEYKLSADSPGPEVMYILTLGCEPKFRKQGVCSNLVSQCTQYATENRACWAIYLHVLHSNEAAIRLYEKLDFQLYEKRLGYYRIDDQIDDACLYIKYLNDAYDVRPRGMLSSIVGQVKNTLHVVYDLLHNLPLVGPVSTALRTSFQLPLALFAGALGTGDDDDDEGNHDAKTGQDAGDSEVYPEVAAGAV